MILTEHQDHPNPGIELVFLLLKLTNDTPKQAEYLDMSIQSGMKSFIFKVSGAHTKLPEPRYWPQLW